MEELTGEENSTEKSCPVFQFSSRNTNNGKKSGRGWSLCNPLGNYTLKYEDYFLNTTNRSLQIELLLKGSEGCTWEKGGA